MIRTRVGPVLMTVFLVVAGEAGAQTAVDISVLDRGKPVGNVNVSAILDEGKVVVGTSNATGQVTLDMNALNITKGTEVSVWIKTCEDGTVEVILVPAGKEGECAEEGQQAGEDCGCRKAGVIIWGDGPVTIDIGTGTVTQAGTAMASGEDHSLADLQIGAMFDYSWYYQLEDTVCGRPGVVSCEADNGVPGIGAYLDYRFGRSNFGLSFEAHYASLDAESTTEDDVRTTFDVNSWQFQLAPVYNIPLRPRFGLYIRSGYALMYNDGDVSSGGQSESRSETGSRFLAGTGFHWPIGENWCARTGFDWTTGFEEEDGDTNARFSFALGYRMDRY